MKTVLYVGNMSCSHCEAAIGEALAKLDGVSEFAIDLENKQVEVEFNSETIKLSDIITAINEQGYDVEIV